MFTVGFTKDYFELDQSQLNSNLDETSVSDLIDFIWKILNTKRETMSSTALYAGYTETFLDGAANGFFVSKKNHQ